MPPARRERPSPEPASRSGAAPARGAWAEDVAARHLESAGLRVLTRNYRIRGGEIDLVAREPGGAYVFVEVKQRTRTSHGTAGEHLGFRKAAHVRRAALFYLGRDDLECRFDAVLVEGTPEEHRLTWLRDAF